MFYDRKPDPEWVAFLPLLVYPLGILFVVAFFFIVWLFQ